MRAGSPFGPPGNRVKTGAFRPTVEAAKGREGVAAMPVTRHVAWWNLENLFDEVNSPFRTDKVKRTLGDSLKGWTPVLRDLKIKQLASVIAQMNDGAGPD